MKLKGTSVLTSLLVATSSLVSAAAINQMNEDPAISLRAACPVTLTQSAVDYFLSLDTGEFRNLRIGARGGGCSGIQYSFQFGAAEDGDYVCSFGQLPVLIEHFSEPYLSGATFDVVNSVVVVNNPNCRV
ncbi:hypothetical protein BGZ63DRAFT_397519 [Mariannaea sp. PMI_226]|nr:hypothetical protein BGZ63DRAFT_397519 [Mariannaea sp. PMI_226]